MMSPKTFKMRPCFKQYIWGGDNLRKIYGKDTPEPPVAESWEVSAHPDGMSVVSGGECDGMTILELCEKYGRDFYGDTSPGDGGFPLMLKILDAADKLSVQVHPDDSYAFANEHGSRGKTEAWYVLRAEENAQLIYGFKKRVTKRQLKLAAENGGLDDILNKVSVMAGDVFYIPAGTVHGVGKGMIIAEIQQSSNITYRVYDYDRLGKDGKKRELHINKAVDVSNTEPSCGREKAVPETKTSGTATVNRFADNAFFRFDAVDITDEYKANTENRVQIIFAAEGSFTVGGVRLNMGESALVSACAGEYSIFGKGRVLIYS